MMGIKEGQNNKLKQKETTTMKTTLTKMIMSSLALACALVCLAATMVPGTSTTARAAADAHCDARMLRGLYIWTFDGYTELRWELWYRKPLCKASGSTEMGRRSLHSAR